MCQSDKEGFMTPRSEIMYCTFGFKQLRYNCGYVVDGCNAMAAI